MRYKSRLTGDLDRWIERGWIDRGRRDDILGDVPDPLQRWSAIGALAILGAVLLAMSALTFVAANWDAMPRLARFATILLALWLAMAGAGRALDRGAGALGHEPRRAVARRLDEGEAVAAHDAAPQARAQPARLSVVYSLPRRGRRIEARRRLRPPRF